MQDDFPTNNSISTSSGKDHGKGGYPTGPEGFTQMSYSTGFGSEPSDSHSDLTLSTDSSSKAALKMTAGKSQGMSTKPKKSSKSKTNPPVGPSGGVEWRSKNGELVTTVMMRNIPNCYTDVKYIVDDINSLGFEGTYDFLYLPRDKRHSRCLGFGFINFIKSSDAVKFARKFQSYRFKHAEKTSKKGNVVESDVQGWEANVLRFQTHADMHFHQPLIWKDGKETPITEAVAEITKKSGIEDPQVQHASLPELEEMLEAMSMSPHYEDSADASSCDFSGKGNQVSKKTLRL